MVKGIGVDIIEIARIRTSIETLGDRFLNKIFTPGERAYCEGKRFPLQHYAARFAVKEAVSKAMATGWTGEFRWKDVEVLNDTSGRPRVALSGMLRERLAETAIQVSISHSDQHVVAVALIEESPP
jgi:holo-[acyl-carrier protein] synthase